MEEIRNQLLAVLQTAIESQSDIANDMEQAFKVNLTASETLVSQLNKLNTLHSISRDVLSILEYTV
jgi:hypothetical protein